MIVTVTKHPRRKAGNLRFVVSFSALPGRTFGPWDFVETARDLTVSALLSSMDARNLVLDAAEHGCAEAQCGR